MDRQQNKTLGISSRRARFFNFDEESRLNRDRRPRVPASILNYSKIQRCKPTWPTWVFSDWVFLLTVCLLFSNYPKTSLRRVIFTFCAVSMNKVSVRACTSHSPNQVLAHAAREGRRALVRARPLAISNLPCFVALIGLNQLGEYSSVMKTYIFFENSLIFSATSNAPVLNHTPVGKLKIVLFEFWGWDQPVYFSTLISNHPT